MIAVRSRESAPFVDLERFQGSAYRVRLDPSTGAMQWVAGDGNQRQVLETEPDANWWLQLKARILGGVVPEGWLLTEAMPTCLEHEAAVERLGRNEQAAVCT